MKMPIRCRTFTHKTSKGDATFALARESNQVSIINKETGSITTKTFDSVTAAKRGMANPASIIG